MVDTARARRARRAPYKGPQPWFLLKLSIAFATAIIAYAGYVYIGRLCIPMIRRERNSLGSRTLGSECQWPILSLSSHPLPLLPFVWFRRLCFVLTPCNLYCGVL